MTASQYYAIQLLAIRREQGRMGELEPAARRLVADNPERPAWRAALANLLCEEGRLEEAREEFERLAAHDFEDVPKDLDWMIAMTLLSDVCADLGDAERAALLYARARAVRGRQRGDRAGRGVPRLGGRLPRQAGSHDGARRVAPASTSSGRWPPTRSCSAPGCLARAQLDYARALGSTDPR